MTSPMDLRRFAFERIESDVLLVHVAADTYPGVADTTCGLRLVGPRYEFVASDFDRGLAGVISRHVHGDAVNRCMGCGL